MINSILCFSVHGINCPFPKFNDIVKGTLDMCHGVSNHRDLTVSSKAYSGQQRRKNQRPALLGEFTGHCPPPPEYVSNITITSHIFTYYDSSATDVCGKSWTDMMITHAKLIFKIWRPTMYTLFALLKLFAGMHWSLLDFQHKDQQCRDLMASLFVTGHG